MDWTFLTALGGLLMGAAALIQALWSRRQQENSAANTISDAAVGLVKPLQERVAMLEERTSVQDVQINGLQGRVKILEKENAELRAGVNLLMTQIVALGHKPLYEPQAREED